MIPDFFHTLIGWRKFESAANGRVLASAGHTDHWWPTADLGEALCRAANDHEAPQLQCTCGFYCYKNRADAEQHAQGTILAKVELWGRLAEHRRGYRAQHMRILELFVSPSFAARSSLASRYHVPVTVDQGADTWISESHFVLLSWSQSTNLLQNPTPPFTIPFQSAFQSAPQPSGPAASQLQQSAYLQQYQSSLTAYAYANQFGLGGPVHVGLPQWYNAQSTAASAPAVLPVTEYHEVELEEIDPAAARVTQRLKDSA